MNLREHTPDSSSSGSVDCFRDRVAERLPQKPLSIKLKIELCRNFMEKGFCIYGYRCNFAHGYEELCVNNENAHKLKTNLCKLFHNSMYCRYGARCNFLHEVQQVDQIVCGNLQKKTNILRDYP